MRSARARLLPARWRVGAVGALTLLLGTSSLAADDVAARDTKAGTKRPAITRLAGVRYYHDVDAARERASAKRTRRMRPVLWLRVLGAIDGKT